jgi:5'(3')-deoxyribonucleotidase
LRIPNKIIGVDLDGVIADIVTQLVRFSRTEYGLDLSPSTFESENIETCTPINAEQLRRLFCDPKFFRTMRAIPGARTSLARLVDAGFTVHIVTDRFWYPGIHDDTRYWISRRAIPATSVVFANKSEKQTIARDLEFRWFIEDQRSNANLLSNVCRVLLLDRPYNQGMLASNVQRTKSLNVASEIIRQHVVKERASLREPEQQQIAKIS